MTKKLSISLLFLLLLVAGASAQNNTHSPFSRFGYGEMNDNVPGAYRAMGGIGIAMRDNRVINPSQPASYTVVDSTTFMFDLAGSGMWNQYSDVSGKRNRGNGNLEYVTMQLPLYKHWIGMSLGLNPYSMVGYDFAMYDSIANDYHYTATYQGAGGVTQIYGGLSFNVLDWFAAGANVYYMFGEVNNSKTLSFAESLASSAESNIIKVSSLRYRVGAQFFHQFSHHFFSVGGVFEPQKPMKANHTRMDLQSNDTIIDGPIASDFPMYWGVGAAYSYDGRFMLSVDYSRYCWTQARYYDESFRLRDRQKIAVGFEYTHNPLGRRYIDHMPWRVGFSMADSYVQKMTGWEYGVSVGTAFPLHNVATVLNTSIEYGYRGMADVMKEHYLRFTLNVSISENWFFKRRL